MLIGGPTASGKSDLALELAQKIKHAVIINADALQVYRPLRILSARPSEQDEMVVPHRLYGSQDGQTRGNVASWLEHVHEEVDAALMAGLTPLLVGGSGMYFYSFLNGLSETPSIPPDIRHEAVTQHGFLGGDGFHAALSSLDPVGAAKLPPGDTQRMVRAYEVVRATGRPLHEWQREVILAPHPEWRIHSFILEPQREWLYARCNNRFLSMLEKGAVAEVSSLLARNISQDSPVFKAVGVPELAAYLGGEIKLEQATARAQQATRNYAKRQLTWFRNQWAEAHRLVPVAQNDVPAMVSDVLEIIRH